jgi:hypothetical protein
MYELTIAACERAKGVIPGLPLGNAIFESIRGLLTEEGSIFGFPEVDWSRPLSIDDGVALRRYLEKKQQFLADSDYLIDVWREKTIRIFEGMLEYLPDGAFRDDEDEGGVPFRVSVVDFLEDLPEVIERLIMTLEDDDVVRAELFERVRYRIENNTARASGLDPDATYARAPKIVFPTQQTGRTPRELVDLYVRDTPFLHFFDCDVPFTFPAPVRFEHTHIVGGTGHGKTQLLQNLIHNDLLKVRDGKASVVVIDSQGDLIRTISHLSYFNPTDEKSLSDKLMLIDQHGPDTGL